MASSARLLVLIGKALLRADLELGCFDFLQWIHLHFLRKVSLLLSVHAGNSRTLLIRKFHFLADYKIYSKNGQGNFDFIVFCTVQILKKYESERKPDIHLPVARPSQHFRVKKGQALENLLKSSLKLKRRNRPCKLRAVHFSAFFFFQCQASQIQA